MNNAARYGVTAFAGSVAVGAFAVAFPLFSPLIILCGAFFVGIACMMTVKDDRP